MSDTQNHDRLDEQGLEALLRSYATTPGPDERFVARLERRLLSEQAARGSRTNNAAFGILASLAARWRRVARPLQPALSVLSRVMALVVLVVVAALFSSWMAGIQQLAADPTEVVPGASGDEIGESLGPQFPSPTADAGLSPTPALRITPTPPKPSDFPHHQNAILVAPSDDLQVPQSEFTSLGINVVPTVDDLGTRMRSETVEIVYFHPDVFRDIPADALRGLYDAGILMVVLDVPASEINTKLPVLNGYEDLRPETLDSDRQFVAAAFQNQDALLPSFSSRWDHRDFYPVDRFWYVVDVVENQLRRLDVALTRTALTPTLPPTGIPFEGLSGARPSPTPPPAPTVTPTPSELFTDATPLPTLPVVDG